MRFLILVAGRVADATRNRWRNIWRNTRRNRGRPSLATVIMFGGADLEAVGPGRVNAELAEERRRGERAAKARRRAVARNCAHWLATGDRKRKLGASRARWAAWKAKRKEQGCG